MKLNADRRFDLEWAFSILRRRPRVSMPTVHGEKLLYLSVLKGTYILLIFYWFNYLHSLSCLYRLRSVYNRNDLLILTAVEGQGNRENLQSE